MRSGGVSTRTHQVRTQTVKVALRVITTKIQLDGQQSPVVNVRVNDQNNIGKNEQWGS